MRESRTITIKLPSWENPITITIVGKIPQENIDDPLYVSDLSDFMNIMYLACSYASQIQPEMNETFHYFMKKFC